jgi:hypothetical protein
LLGVLHARTYTIENLTFENVSNKSLVLLRPNNEIKIENIKIKNLNADALIRIVSPKSRIDFNSWKIEESDVKQSLFLVDDEINLDFLKNFNIPKLNSSVYACRMKEIYLSQNEELSLSAAYNLVTGSSPIPNCFVFRTDQNFVFEFKSTNFNNWGSNSSTSIDEENLLISNSNLMFIDKKVSNLDQSEFLIIKSVPAIFRVNPFSSNAKNSLWPNLTSAWTIANNKLVYEWKSSLMNDLENVLTSTSLNSTSLCGLRLHEFEMIEMKSLNDFKLQIGLIEKEKTQIITEIKKENLTNQIIRIDELISSTTVFNVYIKVVLASPNQATSLKFSIGKISLVSCDKSDNVNNLTLSNFYINNSFFKLSPTGDKKSKINLNIDQMTCLNAGDCRIEASKFVKNVIVRNSAFLGSTNPRFDLSNAYNILFTNNYFLKNTYTNLVPAIYQTGINQETRFCEKQLKIESNFFIQNFVKEDDNREYKLIDLNNNQMLVEISGNMFYSNKIFTADFGLIRKNLDFILSLNANALAFVYNNMFSSNTLSSMKIVNSNINATLNSFANLLLNNNSEVAVKSDFNVNDFYLESNWWGLVLNENQTIINSLVKLNKIYSFDFESRNINAVLAETPDQFGAKSLVCDDQWFEYFGKCLFIGDLNVNYKLAVDFCSSLDGSLAKNLDELYSFVNNTKYFKQNANYWLESGLTDCNALLFANGSSKMYSFNGSCDRTLQKFVCEKTPSLKCNRLCKWPGGVCQYPKCVCNEGWEGVNCDKYVCVNNCFESGQCVGPNQCSCRPGWTGNKKIILSYSCSC